MGWCQEALGGAYYQLVCKLPSGFSRKAGHVNGLVGFWLQESCHQLVVFSACMLCTRGRCCTQFPCEAHAKGRQLGSTFLSMILVPLPLYPYPFTSPNSSFICLHSTPVQIQFLFHMLHYPGYIHSSLQGFGKHSFATSNHASYIRHQFFLFQDILGVVHFCL